MTAQKPADRLAALELIVGKLSARVTELERRQGTTSAGGGDYLERAQRAHQERLTGRPACPTCDGATMLLDDFDRGYPCPSCRPSTPKDPNP